MKNFKLRLFQNSRLLIAIGLFFMLYGLYSYLHPKGGSPQLLVQNANESFALIMAAIAQTFPVLIGGLDLSVGALLTMINCLASVVVNGTPGEIFFGVVLCLVVGCLCGFLNGCIVVYGRLQPIIVTLATGAVYMGVALFLRPKPGGKIDGDLSFAMTFDISEFFYTYGFFEGELPVWFEWIGWFPMPMVLLMVVVGMWLLFKNSRIGRNCYAVGSSESAAYMSGVKVNQAKLAAFALAGLFAAIGGLYLGFQTQSGNADIPQAGAYTLNSIAALVIGGTSLYGGVGGAIGSIFGALVFRSVSFNFRVFDAGSFMGFMSDPLLQPLFEGCVLLIAVCLGATWVFRVKNRLNLFR